MDDAALRLDADMRAMTKRAVRAGHPARLVIAGILAARRGMLRPRASSNASFATFDTGAEVMARDTGIVRRGLGVDAWQNVLDCRHEVLLVSPLVFRQACLVLVSRPDSVVWWAPLLRRVQS